MSNENPLITGIYVSILVIFAVIILTAISDQITEDLPDDSQAKKNIESGYDNAIKGLMLLVGGGGLAFFVWFIRTYLT